MPADQILTTGDPGGTNLTYTAPTATDAADPSPTVGCAPASGSHVDVGTTTVTCTAQDATGNHVSASFSVEVRYVSSVTWSAVWGEPVATSGGVFVANPGRTVPVMTRNLVVPGGPNTLRGRRSIEQGPLGSCSAPGI